VTTVNLKKWNHKWGYAVRKEPAVGSAAVAMAVAVAVAVAGV